jgi:hypothetical protein
MEVPVHRGALSQQGNGFLERGNVGGRSGAASGVVVGAASSSRAPMVRGVSLVIVAQMVTWSMLLYCVVLAAADTLNRHVRTRRWLRS